MRQKSDRDRDETRPEHQEDDHLSRTFRVLALRLQGEVRGYGGRRVAETGPDLPVRSPGRCLDCSLPRRIQRGAHGRGKPVSRIPYQNSVFSEVTFIVKFDFYT